ncbi:MAG: autotransporter-associated beta strand repeat-containing protein, partial [Chthoniobacteraceae bacterium]|nr:autotransporter-associated beta strand repeat-containing protein [Chthoniobacteraceae bacterium]
IISTQGAGTVLNIIGSSSISASVLDVGAGTLIDLNSTGSMNIAGISGSGAIKLTQNNITINTGTPQTSTNTITGGKGITFGSGNNTVTFTVNGSNNYTGGTTIASGGSGVTTVKIANGNAFSNTASLSVGTNGVLQLNGSNETIGTLLGTGVNAAIDNSSTTFSTLTINTAVAGNGSYAGILKNTGTGRLGLTKTGINTQTLTGLSTYTGATTVNNGTLLLDLSTNTTGVLNSAAALQLGGGTLAVQGKSSGVSSQTMGALALTANTGSGLVLNSNGGGGVTQTLGNNWTRGAGATLAIDTSSSAANALISNPSAALANGIITYATVKDASGIGFATGNGTNIVRYTGATPLQASGNNASTNYSTSGNLTLGGSETVNSLAIDTRSAAGSLDLNGGTFSTNALLMSGDANYTIRNGQTGQNDAELIVHQYGTGALTIAGPVSGGSGSLTKAGTGMLILTGSSSYTGATNLNGGTVRFSALNNLGNGGAINFGGGALQYAKGNTADITTRAVTLAGAGGTMDTNGNNVTFAGGMSGNGGLTKTGEGTLTLSGSNTYTGDTAINNGTLRLDLSNNPTGVVSPDSALLLGGGTLNVKGASTGASSQTLGGMAVISGGNHVVVDSNGG